MNQPPVKSLSLVELTLVAKMSDIVLPCRTSHCDRAETDTLMCFVQEKQTGLVASTTLLTYLLFDSDNRAYNMYVHDSTHNYILHNVVASFMGCKSTR